MVPCSLAIHQIETFPDAEVARAPAASAIEAGDEALGPVAESVGSSFGRPVEAPSEAWLPACPGQAQAVDPPAEGASPERRVRKGDTAKPHRRRP